MVEQLIRTYRELSLSKTETLFLLEVIVHQGKYLESEATFRYNPSTIKKIRQSLYDKALITWKTIPQFGDTLYLYDLTALSAKLQYIKEQKPDRTKYLLSLAKAIKL